MLQLGPELVGAFEKRHVVGMFEIGLADDPGLAVGTAPVVAGRKLVDAQHPRPASGQVIQRGAAHAAAADDDNVVHHARCRGLTS